MKISKNLCGLLLPTFLVLEMFITLSSAYSATLSPLTAIPVLNSNPEATASIYLDFDGHFEATWGGYSNISTPVFDFDGDPSTFSEEELAAINSIWKFVAEDFAAFNLNVTTVEPNSFANGVALRVSIGGLGEWNGGFRGGIAYLNSFTNSLVNTVYVFPENLSYDSRRIGTVVSHESGHAFGLNHYGGYSSEELAPPIMSGSTTKPREVWWASMNTAGYFQDDMELLSRSQNGFGYRPDDYGDSIDTAFPLSVSGKQFSKGGIIGQVNDRDYFSFTTDSGPVALKVSVPSYPCPIIPTYPDYTCYYANLNARLELWNSDGTQLILSADPETNTTNPPYNFNFDASISTNLTAGTYHLVVASHGNYGDVGQYEITGTVSAIPNPPSGLEVAAISSDKILLTWLDNSNNELGFQIERSFAGAAWQAISAVGANVVSFENSGLSASANYAYRIQSYNASGNSIYSNIASTTTLGATTTTTSTTTSTTSLPAPITFSATVVSGTRVNLAWSNILGEGGYKLERSLDGVSWVQIATTAANVVSYSNTSLTPGTKYYYRVYAYKNSLQSAYSNIATATTIPPTPTLLKSIVVSSTQINLSWLDGAGEDGYRIERSPNGTSWTVIYTTPSNISSFPDTGIVAGTRYYYRIRAFNNGGNSAYSSSVNTRTIPSAPTLTATVRSTTRIDLSWSNVAGESGYKLERSTDGISWSTIYSAGSSTFSYANTGLSAGTNYWYRIYAYNASGNSAYSPFANAATLK